MRLRTAALTLAAGLGLADASVVTLALPQLLHDLGTTIQGVAAVLAVYTVVLAAALLPAEALARRRGPGPVGAAGFALLAAASIVCGASGSLPVLLVGRAAQAAGAAAGLVAVFRAGRRRGSRPPPVAGRGDPRQRGRAGARRRAHAGVRLAGDLLRPGAAGRAGRVGGVEIRGGGGARRRGRAAGRAARGRSAVAGRAARGRSAVAGAPLAGEAPLPSSPLPARPAAALALVSAALTAVLFLLVLLLVAGWAVSPIRAAVAVTVIPLGALAGARAPGEAELRAAVGAALIGAGVLALAWLPQAHVTWTLVPAAVGGVGMGMSLTALTGSCCPSARRGTRPGSWPSATPGSRSSSPRWRRSSPIS